MNKVITDGVLLTPPPFANGLDVYSSGNGTPGSDTYEICETATLIQADDDFGSCLELRKTSGVQHLRYMGETPLLPGCYLRITARVKAISGALPKVAIGAFAGGAGGAPVGDVVTSSTTVPLRQYGEVVTVSAIVGAGVRSGVDMVWGGNALYGHFGIDLSGPDGGVVRVDDLVIEDITSVYLRDMLSTVDVRDYGAVGDGITDDTAAFAAANRAAGARDVLVSKGRYLLNGPVIFDGPVRFEGTVSMPAEATLILRRNFDLSSYVAAFGDTELAFKKGVQALLHATDHGSFDLCARKVAVFSPIDMQALMPAGRPRNARRVIRNGQLEAQGLEAWDTEVVTSAASYDPADGCTLRDVVNVADVPVGALVEGDGVGREVYVRSKSVDRREITLSAGLRDATDGQTFTFRRFKYILDFSGVPALDRVCLSDVEFQCDGVASGVMLAPSGCDFQVKDCFFTRPKDRAITSIGAGCRDMVIERCHFISSEGGLDVPERSTIALNANAINIKLRDCRSVKFLHFAVLAGANAILSGNHVFQGDTRPAGERSAGIVLSSSHANTSIYGNYIDNCFVEWANEHDGPPHGNWDTSFSALSISDNIFLASDVAGSFSFVVMTPSRPGYFLSGVSITGNHFRSVGGVIERADRVDTRFATLDGTRMRNIRVEGNSFHNIIDQMANPLRLRHAKARATATWVIETRGALPFGAQARSVDAVLPVGQLTEANGMARFETPAVTPQQGANGDAVHLSWGVPLRGEVQMTLRIDV